MNQRELVIRKKQVYGSYHVTGCGNYVRRAKNAVYLSAANSIKHELKKAEICWNLLKEGKDFITEAVCNRTGLRRDIVILDTGQEVEIETTKVRAERHGADIEVVMA